MFDLAIVGSGILGSSAACHAVQAGLSVLLCEAGERANEATVRNFGQIVPSGQSLEGWRQLGMRSLKFYEALRESAGIPVVRGGSLYVASDAEEATLLEELHALDKQMDYPSALLTAAQCLERLPALRTDYAVAGLFYPQELSADSPRLVPAILNWLGRHSRFSYRNRTLITRVGEDAAHCELVTASGEVLQARRVLVCSGHLLNRLFPATLAEAGMRISKLQMMCTPPWPEVKLGSNVLTGLTIRRYEAFAACASHARLSLPEAHREHRELGIHVLFKQNADGCIIIGDSHEYFAGTQVDCLDYAISERINRLIIEEAKRIVALPDWCMARYWNGYYCQHDADHIYMRTLGRNVHVVTGIGGKGMSTGPGLMERVVRAVVDEVPLESLRVSDWVSSG